MTLIASLLLLAAVLPWLASIFAKAGGKGFNNADPRIWLAQQEGWRARAIAVQDNLFEGLPFFFAAVLFALYNDVALDYLSRLMMAWLAARLAFFWFYISGRGTLRSLVWGLALALNIIILFAAT